MRDYTEMSGEERFSEVDRMAAQLIGSNRWKAPLARRYGMTPEAVGQWMRKGAPVWICVALRDALAAKALSRIKDALRIAEGAPE